MSMVKMGGGEYALTHWSRQIPETVVAEIIKILRFDPDALGTSSWTMKYEFWSSLSFIIRRLGKPTPKVLGTTPTDLRDCAADLQSTLSNALITLKSMEYGSVYQSVEQAGAKTKELIVSNKIRGKSKSASKGTTLFADVFARQHHALHGKWPKLYKFDHELPAVIEALEHFHFRLNRRKGIPLIVRI